MIRTLLVAFCVAGLLSPLAAQDPKPPADADSHEKVVRDMLATLKAAAKAFAEVKDADAAKKSRPEIEKLADAMRTFDDRITKLGALSKEQEADLEKKFKTDLDDIFKTYTAQTQRLLKESWGKDLVALLEKKPAAKPQAK